MASRTYNSSGSRTLCLIYERWESDPADTEYSQTGAQSTFGTIDRATTDQSFSAIFESAETLGDLEGTRPMPTPKWCKRGARATIPSVLLEDTDNGHVTLSLDARLTSDTSLAALPATLVLGGDHLAAVADGRDGGAHFHRLPFRRHGDALCGIRAGGTRSWQRFTLVSGLRLE